MDDAEQFVLDERNSERQYKANRLLYLTVGTVILLLFGMVYRCDLRHHEIDAEIKQATLVAYTACLQKKPHVKCQQAYYPRVDPQIERQRAELATLLYKHCTDETSVSDFSCDEQVEALMESITANRSKGQ